VGFLPENIEVAPRRSRAFGVATRGKKVFGLGFPKSLERYNINKDIKLRPEECVQLIEFAELGEGQLLSWERAFANVAVAAMKKDSDMILTNQKVPDLILTNLDPKVARQVMTRQDILDFPVGVLVTADTLATAKKLYEQLERAV